MAGLLITIKKKTDGTAALSCRRDDGSVTWQRQEGQLGRFFPLHDLTHYAVETVLGHRRGFFGLLAEGWDVTDFGNGWPRGPIPADAEPSELIVGFLDAERASGAHWSAADCNDKLATWLAARGPGGGCMLTDEDLARVRARRAELFAAWREVPPGETLDLRFDQPPEPAGPASR
jgi:hypothetical protein